MASRADKAALPALRRVKATRALSEAQTVFSSFLQRRRLRALRSIRAESWVASP